jgi:hypothetical protein
LKDIKDDTSTDQEDFTSYLRKTVISDALKLRGKFLPISESVRDARKKIKIKFIHDLSTILKNFYLIVAKNYSSQPKVRYFLVINLASQSSDFLVNLARDYALNHNLKLIQYSLFPETHRISLLSLKEIVSIEEYTNSIEILKNFRIEFRKTLDKIKTKINNF